MKYVVYKFYDAEENLLYIGQSSNFASRVGQHVNNSDWFDRVARADITHCEDSREANALERRWIKIFNPPHNIKSAPKEFCPRPEHIKRQDVPEDEDYIAYVKRIVPKDSINPEDRVVVKCPICFADHMHGLNEGYKTPDCKFSFREKYEKMSGVRFPDYFVKYHESLEEKNEHDYESITLAQNTKAWLGL